MGDRNAGNHRHYATETIQRRRELQASIRTLHLVTKGAESSVNAPSQSDVIFRGLSNRLMPGSLYAVKAPRSQR
jgi:hypothetical protein